MNVTCGFEYAARFASFKLFLTCPRRLALWATDMARAGSLRSPSLSVMVETGLE